MNIMKFKYVLDDSQVKGIGALFRCQDDSNWYVNVVLSSSQNKTYFSASQLPVMARRRIFNATKRISPAGYSKTVSIGSTNSWRSAKMNSCPISSVNKASDSEEWCFVFNSNDVMIYLPQLELARALFFHTAYITRLSLIPQGLGQDFGTEITSLGAAISILPTSKVPLFVRKDPAHRRLLAWILLDKDARRSYESISKYQIQDGEVVKNYRRWHFQFDPPTLEDVTLNMRGFFEKASNTFFVYEIVGIANLSANCPWLVEFVDPYCVESDQGHSSGSGASGSGSVVSVDDVDDDAPADEDSEEERIEAPKVDFGFNAAFITVRMPHCKAGAGGSGAKENGASDGRPDTASGYVTTDESSVDGNARPGDFDQLNDITDDAHLYWNKFAAFNQMVDLLIANKSYKHDQKKILKLPAVNGCSKHLLEAGNPRCIAYHLISHRKSNYALVEVDTSDNKSRLSTLLLKQPSPKFDWHTKVLAIAPALVKRSLVWPTKLLTETFGNGCERIPHPKTDADHRALFDEDAIKSWADRVLTKIP